MSPATRRPPLPPPGCNVALAERVATAFLREESEKFGFSRAVVGVSGGLDSAVVLELAARAFGPDQVQAVAMPFRESAPESLALAREVAAHAGTPLAVVDVSPMADAFLAAAPELPGTETAAGRLRRGNVLARIRMVVLYDWSAARDALVLGTSNKTELLLGYGTLYGDMASALNPIGDLYKTQVQALGRHVGVPEGILQRPPSADLWQGQTDEGELGFTYAEVDALLHYLVDRRYPREVLLARGFGADFVDEVLLRVRRNQYKRRPPVIAKLANRTVNLDFRYARDWGA